MEFSDQDADQEDLQRRSETYEPDVQVCTVPAFELRMLLIILQGPLVSQKESISGLLTEYQNADQSFITKLTAGCISSSLGPTLTISRHCLEIIPHIG